MLPIDKPGNPFNDPHLDKVYVWKKKAKKLGWSKSEAKANAEAQRARNIPAIEDAKRRRLEREEEIAERLKERERLERERDSASYAGWEAREEDFMLRQHQQASAIRINQGRERPIDVVARNVLLTKQLRFGAEIGPDGKAAALLGSDVGVENTSPLELFPRLSTKGLEQLRDDLEKYSRLEGSGPFAPFWRALMTICEDEIKNNQDTTQQHQQQRLPQVVRDSIREGLKQKSLDEIQQEINEAEKKRDVASSEEDRLFYGELVERLRIEYARAQISKFHEDMVQTAKDHGRTVHNVRRQGEMEGEALPAKVLEEDDESEDQVEAPFHDLVDIPINPKDSQQDWVKPRYWNRVRTGYDWNKYNRAHFDRDNPPPKTVMGYKFNIMYPGLKKTPTYRFEVDPTDPDNFCIIRFCASHPFQDIAFRIEKKEWERGTHSGYKNTYENGVLQLHFNFTRRRYRR